MYFNGSPHLHLIRNADGQLWMDFRKNLKPRYGYVWMNITVAWIMIGLGIVVLRLAHNVLYAVPAALWFTFWLQCYTGHFHEATHFNLAPTRKVNDFVANVFLTPFTGLGVKSYRESHWKHHLHLGTTQDTETSYYHPIILTRLIYLASGLYILQAIRRYLKEYRTGGGSRKSNDSLASSFIVALVYTALFQAVAVVILFYFVSLPAAIGWAFSVTVLLPNLQNVRQTLEHRSFEADENVDYSKVDHGPVNRLFGSDPFSKSLGSAGFNRHLLHHWDPGLSYTCFDDMEAFLMNSEYRRTLENNRTTYWKAFKAMFRWR